MLLCLFIKNLAENNVLVDDVVLIAFIDDLRLYFNVDIRTFEKLFRQRYLIWFPPFISCEDHIELRSRHLHFPAFVIVLAGALKVFVIALCQI